MVQIEASHLMKSFGALTAVNDLSLQVETGEIFGMVGSDGAGKTTTLRLLVGALKTDSGEINICGFNLKKNGEEARSRIGYLSQRFSLYDDLTVLENIRFFAEMRGLERDSWLPRCLEILAFVGLVDFKDRLAGQLSGGMKQKLGLASALVSQPQVLLLDEPTTGVDPVTRQDFWQLILRVTLENQLAVLLTTPYMDEASRCSRLGFMRHGKIIAQGTPAELRSSLVGRIIEVYVSSPILMEKKVRGIPGILDARVFGDKLHLLAAPERISEITVMLEKVIPMEDQKIGSPRVLMPSLEDIFISLSQEE